MEIGFKSKGFLIQLTRIGVHDYMCLNKPFHFVTCQKKNDNELWVCTFKEHAMAVLNLKTGECHLMDGPSGFSVPSWGGSKCFLTSGNYVFFVELSGQRIIKYNFKEGDIQCYPLMEGYSDCSDVNYLAAIMQGKYVWVFPKYENIIYAFDIEKNAVTKYEIKINSRELEMYYKKPLFVKARKNFLTVSLFSTVLKTEFKFNLATREINANRLPENVGECLDIAVYNGEIYALTINNEVYRWNEGAYIADKIMDFHTKKGFSRVVATRENLWLLPSRSDKIIKYDLSRGNYYEYEDYPDGFKFNEEIGGQARFFLSCEYCDVEYFAMCATTHMLSINKATGKADWLRVHGPKAKEYFELLSNSNKINVTESIVPLNKFLMVLTERNNDVGVGMEQQKAVGKRIYDFFVT